MRRINRLGDVVFVFRQTAAFGLMMTTMMTMMMMTTMRMKTRMKMMTMSKCGENKSMVSGTVKIQKPRIGN